MDVRLKAWWVDERAKEVASLAGMMHAAQRTPKSSTDRIILHFDYDCFYASCIEKHSPELKTLPLAIQQKHIIVTSNYVARSYGLRKLQLIGEAKKLCPDLIIVLGEDLTLFRNESKANFNFLKSYVWSGRVEKLGFDEVFMDVTDQIDYNLRLAENSGFGDGFFQLSQTDATKGFKFDWNRVPGNIHPRLTADDDSPLHERICRRLLLGAHLAYHLRMLLHSDCGFTCSAGISHTKLSAKLAGTVHKPNKQTLLQPAYIQDFLDIHEISKIPGIGSKTARMIRDAAKEVISKNHKPEDDGMVLDDAVLNGAGERAYADREDEKQKQLAKDESWRTYYGEVEVKLKVHAARTLLSRAKLETLLGTSQPNGQRVWELLHGIDLTEVVPATAIPTQISIEDTFRQGTMASLSDVAIALERLCASLLRRMHTDLLVDPMTDQTLPPMSDADWSDALITAKWLAFPKTLRLSTRDRDTVKFGARASKSVPMPNVMFSLTTSITDISIKVVKETLLPLFKRMHSSDSKWDLALLNVAAVNMTGGETGQSGGDVGAMFKRYNEVFPEGDWEKKDAPTLQIDLDDEVFSDDEDASPRIAVGDNVFHCDVCGAGLPLFAIDAHERFHKLENG